jgi:hypothetical protein
MADTFVFTGPAGKLANAASFGKTLSITQSGLLAPAKLFVPGLGVAYDETQLPGTVFDVQFLEDIAVVGPTFLGQITLVSKGA